MQSKHKLIGLILMGLFIVPLGITFASTGETESYSKVNQSRTDEWILDLQKNIDNPQWYFDNLVDADRLKIRLAMDYAIPRDSIIDSLMGGQGARLATYVLPQTGRMDSSIVARDFNLTLAASLLADVFGYTYAEDDDDATTPYDESAFYFKITPIVPTTNTLRSQWAGRISLVWQGLGIDVTQKHLTWGVTLPRIIDNPPGVGFDYAHGGFDAWYVGQNADPDPAVRTFFHTQAQVPKGQNYFFTNDPVLDELLNQTEQDPVEANRNAALNEFQQWQYDNVPASIIRQEVQVFGLNEDLEGFDPFAVWNYENWTCSSCGDTLVVTMPGELIDLNPQLSASYYDYFVADPINGGARRGGLFSIRVPNGDPTYFNWDSFPYLAESATHTADFLEWTVKIKPGLKWHDGQVLDADDVVFSYVSDMSPAIGTYEYGLISGILGSNASVVKVDNLTVKFTLPEFYPYVESVLFNIAILPEHILKDVDAADWATHYTNVGTATQGPIGFGPYKYTSTVDGVVTLTKWADYNGTLMGTPDPTITTIKVQVVKDSSAALTALKNGEVHFVDSQTGLNGIYDDIVSPAKPVQYLEYGWQEVGYNAHSPIWGYNAADPNEKYEDSGAASFDIVGIFAALFGIAIVGFVIRKRK